MIKLFPAVLVAAVVFAGAGWSCTDNSDPSDGAESSASSEAPEALRKMFLELTPEKAGITLAPNQQVWGGAMDWSVGEDATLTVVSLMDGTASVYFSSGGGFIGAGEHEPVRNAALTFVESLQTCASDFKSGSIRDLPPTGRIRFYALSRSGLIHSEEVSAVDLGDASHPLRSCFMAAQDVVTKVRLISEEKDQR